MNKNKNTKINNKEIYIKIAKNGPYLVYGVPKIVQEIIIADENGICIKYSKGKSFEIKTTPVQICRCGNSINAPFCDGSHNKCNFDGTETASHEEILNNAEIYEGPNLTLYDNEKYCALARFCDAKGGIWALILDGNKKSDAYAIEEANLCPSGRLIIFDKTGNIIENKLPISISVLEDAGLKISGPIWVKGGIRVESLTGESYEIRNRQTLCRCGKSLNKPFCDSAHTHLQFKAKYKD